MIASMSGKGRNRGWQALVASLLGFILAFGMVPAQAFATGLPAESAAAGEAAAEVDPVAEGAAEVDAAVEGDDSSLPSGEPVGTPDIAVPVPEGRNLTYNGEWQLGIDPAEGWEYACADGVEGHFDSCAGCWKRDAGQYSCVLRLKDGYVWADGSYGDAVVPWSIQPDPADQGFGNAGSEQPSEGTGVQEDPAGAAGTGDAQDSAAGSSDRAVEPIKVPLPPEGGRFYECSEELNDWMQLGIYRYSSYKVEGLPCVKVSTGIEGNDFDYGLNTVTYVLNPGAVWEDGTTDSKFVEVEVLGWGDLSSLVAEGSIGLGYTSCVYSGEEEMPWIECYDEEFAEEFFEGMDYEISYSNNVNVGTATATITGLGVYYGSSATLKFKIKPKSAAKLSVSLSRNEYVANGTYRKPRVTVKDGARILKAGTDYTVGYSNNKAVGSAKVTITGKGNYTGTKAVSFNITPRKTGWYSAGGYWYYKGLNGLARGWRTIGGKRYYFHPTTKRMATGLRKIDGKYYSFASSGAMHANCWVGYNGRWYCFSSNGTPRTGWVSYGSDWYWFDSSGRGADGEMVKIDGKYAFFDKEGRWICSSAKTGFIRLKKAGYYTNGRIGYGASDYCYGHHGGIDAYIHLDPWGRAMYTGSMYTGRYEYWFDGGIATVRHNLATGEYDFWTHDSGCSWRYGCRGCYWE